MQRVRELRSRVAENNLLFAVENVSLIDGSGSALGPTDEFDLPAELACFFHSDRAR